MKRSIKFVYFDIGGVLLRWRGALVKLAERHGTDPDHVRKVFHTYDNDFCRGVYTETEMWQIYCRDLGLKDSFDFDYVAFCTGNFVAIEETHQLAQSLAAHYEIGLLTNLQPGAFEHIIALGQVPDISYKAIVKSYEVGFVKPEKEIYHIAQKKAGVAPDEIFFIDDLERNIDMAKNLGWQGHVFDEQNPKDSIRSVQNILLDIAGRHQL